ncbi:monofunctional biosynthetic peptidoglycan transglycosylase [soil metagenome]
MWKRLLIALPLAVLGALWFYWVTIPWPVRLRTHDPAETAVMRQRIAEARARDEGLEIRHQWAPLERISPRLRRAVVVAEDGRFYEHDGIDWDALREEFRYGGDADFSFFDADDRRALLASLRYYRENRHRIRGRSTITQQLAKNLYYSTDRSLVRKLEEFVVARRLERFLTKDRILEIYLNVVELGPGIFGVEAASRHYFSRSAADLSAEQAAMLAATLPHPLTSNPRTRPGRMEWRKGLILSRMGGVGPVRTVPLEPVTVDTTTTDTTIDTTTVDTTTVAPPPIGDPIVPIDTTPAGR